MSVQCCNLCVFGKICMVFLNGFYCFLMRLDLYVEKNVIININHGVDYGRWAGICLPKGTASTTFTIYLCPWLIEKANIIISIYIEMNSSQKGQSNCYQSQCSSLDQIQVFRVAGVHSSIMIASQWWISFDQRITFYAGYTGHSWTVINTPIACCWLTHLIWGSGIITWIECTIHANLFSVSKFFSGMMMK